MKVNCDLQLTLMASSLYRLLGTELGKEYTNAKSRRIFRDFIDATAVVTIDSSTITVQFQKRAHNPHLLEARLRSEANPRSLARWPSSPAHLRMINARRSNPMGSSSHLTPNDVPGADTARSGDGADPDVRSERLRGNPG